MSTNGAVARRCITAPGAPPAVGPYTHAVRHADLLFCSGALPLHPDTQELVADSLADETSQCLHNLAAVCEAAGTQLANPLRTTIYTTDLAAFAEINDAYAAFFAGDPPARVAVGVAALPKNARVEIDAIVAVS
jgi:2-iminobutanoate/2-iminopropanoate deaminase